MGSTELQLIADILTGLGDTSITGLIWFLGVGMLKYILLMGLLLVVVYAAYKILNRLMAQSQDQSRLKELSALVESDWRPGYDTANFQRLHAMALEQVKNHKANVETIKKQNADLSTYDRMVVKLEMDLEEAQKQRDTYQQALLHVEEEAIAKAKENDKHEEK